MRTILSNPLSFAFLFFDSNRMIQLYFNVYFDFWRKLQPAGYEPDVCTNYFEHKELPQNYTLRYELKYKID